MGGTLGHCLMFGLSWMLASNPGFPFPNFSQGFGEKCETKLLGKLVFKASGMD